MKKLNNPQSKISIQKTLKFLATQALNISDKFSLLFSTKIAYLKKIKSGSITQSTDDLNTRGMSTLYQSMNWNCWFTLKTLEKPSRQNDKPDASCSKKAFTVKILRIIMIQH